MSRTWKLSTFPRTFSEEEIILNPSDFPTLRPNDIVEIYHPEDPNPCRLLLEIRDSTLSGAGSSSPTTCGNAVFVAKRIADSFLLRNYEPVVLRKLNSEEIPRLESLEVSFKEEYMGRSEMWRIKAYLLKESRCLHVSKRIDFSGIRVTVENLKSRGGTLLSCGIVTPDTKIIFRSSSAMVYLFIQMSQEMWGGDLYFDKAIDGFLSELFERWSSHGCVHDVTIVLFSRCFYEASDYEEFPEEMRSCIIKRHDGRFYQDFYRVVVQNERFVDWRPTLVQLRNLYQVYKKTILEYHTSNGGMKVPKAYLSNASEGNFLEVINMSLNTFDNHYQNRSLDRTGQQTIVITPGVGVYEVDRELSSLTKKRLIDSGVGSDLLCLGEQPLHSVPLFKFYSSKDSKEEYGIPHWIHLSFYTSPKSSYQGNFTPRIKIPPNLIIDGERKPYFPSKSFSTIDEKDQSFYIEYDRLQFAKLPPVKKGEPVRPGLLLSDPVSDSKRITSNRRRWTHIFSEYSSSSVSNYTMGVDWKSLTTPASLPITTDYFPESKDFENYVFNEYSLNPEEINENTANISSCPNNIDSSVVRYLENMEVFRELVSQRLAQGFQIVEFDKPDNLTKNVGSKKKAMQGEPYQEYWLSIGQIFHKVSLSADMKSIHVTRYSPRNPVQTSRQCYKYRFQAPDNDTYEVSWVEFGSEKLENFNWNHMDYYVCTRGDKDFILTESLKYWRFRMYILPLTPYIPYTKKIKEGSSEFCDIYECLDIHELVREGFLKFAENCLNSIRRCKKSFSGSVGEKEKTEGEDLVHCLKSKLMFVTKQTTLPSSTFITAEAIQFLMENRKTNFSNKKSAISALEKLRQSGKIRHASGDSRIPVVDGFVLFYFVDECSETYYKGDIEAFRNEWVEIQIDGDKVKDSFLAKTINKFSKKWNLNYRSITVDIDPNNQSDRQEWGHLKYQTQVDSDSAFEVVLQWSVATGALVSELIHGWSRKGQQMYGLSVIPVPSDPFALPVTPNSDPVRGPIFIELNTEFLKASTIPKDEFSWEQRTFLFRETVARKFGFIPCYNQERSSSIFSTHHQYIHCTGNCFLLIPTQLKLKTGIQGYRDSVISSTNDQPEKNEEQNGDNKDFRPLYDHSKTGFLWSWNFMISKRWKMMSNTGATGSIQFMDKLLADFRRFCQNDSDRLRKLWENCWASK